MADKELSAMQAISDSLTELEDEDAIRRVLQWAAAKHGVELIGDRFSARGRSHSSDVDSSHTGSKYNDIADLYDAANPATEPEKVAVAAFWFQEIEGNGDFDSQSLNTELKNLGHGIGNITRALDNLIGRKPRLVIQTRKSGTSQQARKRYKLTTEGIKFVKAMIVGAAGEQGA